MESSWIVAYYHTLHLTLSYFVCCVCIFWRGYVDRIKKKEKKITGKKKKVRRPIHDFQAILVEAFCLSRESGQQHFSDNSRSLCLFLFFLYLLLSYSSSSSPSLSSVLSLFLLLSFICLLQHSFPTIPNLHLTAVIFSLNQSVRNTGTASLSISISQGTNKQTDLITAFIIPGYLYFLATTDRILFS